MNKLSGFTDSPNQSTVVTLDDGSFFTIALYYRQQQNGWFFDLSYGDFLIQGQRLVSGENILRQFRERIPFGLAVFTTTGLDPWRITDLTSRDTEFVLLDASDVEQIEQANFTRNE